MKEAQRLDAEIGQRLAAARRRRELSQITAAKVLSMSQSKLAKLELGAQRLLFSDAIEFARHYEVPLSCLDPATPWSD